MDKEKRPLHHRIYRFFFPGIDRYLEKELESCEAVIDLGCGPLSPIRHCSTKHTIGTDIHRPYIERSKASGIHSDYFISNLRGLALKEKSIDATLLIDVLEHVPKDQGMALLEAAEKWTRKKVIVVTPNGFVDQHEEDGNPFQEHLSGWSAQDFRDLGFRVFGHEGMAFLRGYRGRPKIRPWALGMIASDLTQKFVFNDPNRAFKLFCIKDL